MNRNPKKISLRALLKLQLFYCVLGIAYNVVSYLRLISGSQPLSSTSPLIGFAFMLFYGICLVSGFRQFLKTYRWLMAFFLISIGYSGIIKHFIVYAQQPETYSSQLAWSLAIGINLFGFLLNALAVSGMFKTN